MFSVVLSKGGDSQKNTCWIGKGEGTFIAAENLIRFDELTPGLYKVIYKSWEDSYTCKEVKIDNSSLVDIVQPELKGVIESIDHFYESRELFKNWNILHKRGILLYGAPGGGKSSVISKLVESLVSRGGVAFIVDGEESLEFYAKFYKNIYRNIEPDRQVMTIFEDIDAFVGRMESTLLNVLDGIGETGNIVNIATTNYPENLPERVINRPNRFDRVVEVKCPSEEDRRKYFENKIIPEEITNIDLDEWVKATDKFSIAQLSEVIKSVFLFGETLNRSIQLVKDMAKKRRSEDSDPAKKKIGFGNKEEE